MGLFDQVMKICMFLTGTEFHGQMCTYQISKKAMFLVVRVVHNLSPDAIWYSENVEESDILAEAECGL